MWIPKWYHQISQECRRSILIQTKIQNWYHNGTNGAREQEFLQILSNFTSQESQWTTAYTGLSLHCSSQASRQDELYQELSCYNRRYWSRQLSVKSQLQFWVILLKSQENWLQVNYCWLMHRYFVCELYCILEHSFKSNQVQNLQLYSK